MIWQVVINNWQDNIKIWQVDSTILQMIAEICTTCFTMKEYDWLGMVSFEYFTHGRQREREMLYYFWKRLDYFKTPIPNDRILTTFAALYTICYCFTNIKEYSTQSHVRLILFFVNFKSSQRAWQNQWFHSHNSTYSKIHINYRSTYITKYISS